jgi:hypothetical protein
MDDKKNKTQQNEGEGNRTAARRSNKAQAAGKAVASDERRDADLVGKRHAAEDDPKVKR